MSGPCPRCLDLRPGDLLSAAAIQWLKTGERGVSSEAIFSHLTNIPLNGIGGMSPPYDLGDFRRCQTLLDAVPAFRERLHEMSSVSDYWAAIVTRWDEIADLVTRRETVAARDLMRNLFDRCDAARRKR